MNALIISAVLGVVMMFSGILLKQKSAIRIVAIAGILVLLPAVERDSVVTVLRSLLQADPTPATILLTAAVVASLVLAIGVLWLVVLELTRFYFHANHIQHADGEVFTPRFTLTGLRLPIDELGPASTAAAAPAPSPAPPAARDRFARDPRSSRAPRGPSRSPAAPPPAPRRAADPPRADASP